MSPNPTSNTPRLAGAPSKADPMISKATAKPISLSTISGWEEAIVTEFASPYPELWIITDNSAGSMGSTGSVNASSPYTTRSMK